MKKIVVLIGFLAFIFTATKAQNITEKEGLFYKNSEIFTGTYQSFHPNNSNKSEVKIRKEKNNGKTTLNFEN